MYSGSNAEVFKQDIPVVTSVMPVQIRFTRGYLRLQVFKRAAKMENRMIYPPNLVKDSNPFIMPASTIPKFK